VRYVDDIILPLTIELENLAWVLYHDSFTISIQHLADAQVLLSPNMQF
jgi:hypothetical protein